MHMKLPKRSQRAVMLLVAAALMAGCHKAEEAEQSPVVTVDVAPVTLAKISDAIRADGVLYARQQAAIIPKITAPVARRLVERGQRVHAGQLLLELENKDLAGAALKGQAAYDAAQATYETTARATVPEEQQKAQLDVNSAKAELDAAQKVYDSRQDLLKQGAIAEKDVNDARVALSQAQTAYQTAQKHLEDLMSFAQDQALKAAAATRDTAKGDAQSAEAQLSYSRITSPIDGVVTDIPYYPGETPQSGAPVVTVMDTSQVIAKAHVTQLDATRLKVGDDANLIGPDNVPVPGKVSVVSPALDAANTTVEIWVQAANGQGQLRPGMSVRVEMIAKTNPSALVIPTAAIVTSPSGGTYTIVVDNENAPHVRKVSVGVRNNGQAEITDGLSSGERVATTGAFELFKMEPDDLKKVKVQIAPAKEEEEPEES
jgi:multidrug efflux pump subunit AcrA (membrane-fusion protein)